MEILTSQAGKYPAPVKTVSRSFLAVWSLPIFWAAVAVAYVGTIGSLPLLGKDEPRYVQVAHEMWGRGDWITPTLGGHTWFEKPALLYWFMIASFGTFGVSEWAARLFPALCGLGTVALVFWIAKRVERGGPSPIRGLALWSAATLCSCVGLIAYSHAATFDIVLTASVTLALSCFFVSELETEPRKRQWLMAGFWVAIGLSLLAKGLVGIVLPGGVVLLYLAMRRDWRVKARLNFVWGFPLALAVAAAWYGPVIARHGQLFVNEFFVQHHFARYLTNKYQHPQPLYYYLPVTALLAAPWTPFLLTSLRASGPAIWRADDACGKLRVFVLAWLIVPVAFFSFSGSKLAGYVLPALPAGMLLVGLDVTAYVNGDTGSGRSRATGMLVLLLGTGLAAFAARAGVVTWVGTAAVALPLMAAGIFALLTARHRALSIAFIAGATLVSAGLLTGIVGVPMAEAKGVRALLRTADVRGDGGEPIWQMGTTQRTAEFYGAGRLLYDKNGEPHEFRDAAEISRALPFRTPVLVLTPVPMSKLLLQSRVVQAEVVANNGDVALLRVRSVRHGNGRH